MELEFLTSLILFSLSQIVMNFSTWCVMEVIMFCFPNLRLDCRKTVHYKAEEFFIHLICSY